VLFCGGLSDDKKTLETPLPQLDERAIAKKYGLRELSYPDSEQIKTLVMFLTTAIDAGRCGPVPKTAVVVVLDFLQGTINRQHITKGPRMPQEEFDTLQTPYYTAARVVTKVMREREEGSTKGKVYESTYLSLNQFMELLRSLLDPGCYWLRLKDLPAGVRDVMDGLRAFLTYYPEQRRKGRAM
jgi:hypothetical protein